MLPVIVAVETLSTEMPMSSPLIVTPVAVRLPPSSSAMPVNSDEPEIARPEIVTETD